MVFTLNALLTKPAISLAPMLVTNILNVRFYENFSQDASLLGKIFLTKKSPKINYKISKDDAAKSSLFDWMFAMACFYPVVFAILEAIALVPYRMKFVHKTESLAEAQVL